MVYYDYKSRPPSRRSVEDAELERRIAKIWRENFSCYGAEKMWRQLQRDGVACGRDRVSRLMGDLGITGVVRGRPKRTTVPAPRQDRPGDLVKRNFKAPEPNLLWVADVTYVRTQAGFAYAAFVVDVFARVVVGWAVSASLRADLALAALEMGIFSRRDQDLSRLVHHSDRGVQYLAVRYTNRLEEEEAVGSVGSKGDSYDKAVVSYCTSFLWLGVSSFGETGSHLLYQARVAGCRRLEKPYVLVVCLVRDKQPGTVPSLHRRGADAELLAKLGDGEQPSGFQALEVACQPVRAA